MLATPSKCYLNMGKSLSDQNIVFTPISIWLSAPILKRFLKVRNAITALIHHNYFSNKKFFFNYFTYSIDNKVTISYEEENLKSVVKYG